MLRKLLTSFYRKFYNTVKHSIYSTFWQIKFGKCVKDWFRRNVDDGSDCNEKKTTLSGMGLRIYNYSTPLKVCSNPWMIVFCFPCWFLFGGPCYLVSYYSRLFSVLVNMFSNDRAKRKQIKKCYRKFISNQKKILKVAFL